MVTMAGRPSGIAATARPTAAMNISLGGWLWTMVPKTAVIVAAARDEGGEDTTRPIKLLQQGCRSCSTPRSISEMRPISVLLAVSTTSPSAVPWTTMVLAKAMEVRSARTASLAVSLEVLSTGWTPRSAPLPVCGNGWPG